MLQDIDEFIGSAPPGNGILKMIMCLTPLGEQQVDGITPFWKAHPVSACEYSIFNSIMFASLSDITTSRLRLAE